MLSVTVEKVQLLAVIRVIQNNKVGKMATRRRSMAVLPNPAPARATSSRRASSGIFAAPLADKPKTGRVTKKRTSAPIPIPKAPKDDSFVSGDMFDFVGKIFNISDHRPILSTLTMKKFLRGRSEFSGSSGPIF